MSGDRKTILKKVVAELTYKPGWKFAVETFKGLGLTDEILAFDVKAEAICIDTGKPITIDRTFPWNEPVTDLTKFLCELMPLEYQAKHFVGECIKSIEQHEFNEWLRFGGKSFNGEVHGEDGYDADVPPSRRNEN